MSTASRAAATLVLAPVLLAQSLEDPRLVVEEWASGLARPTGFAFLARGEALVFENLTGRVRHVLAGTVVGSALDLDVAAQGGLGLELSPDFATSGHVFLYFCPGSGGDGTAWVGSELWRYRWDGAALVEPAGPLFAVPHDGAQSNPDHHNSGVLRFGPDGRLYVQVGDKDRGGFDDPRVEQNTAPAGSAWAGGIARLEPDGSIPFDNPFAGDPDPGLAPWWVYGFRNSLGMAFDPLGGALWFSENGPEVYDELNRAEPAMDSGWRLIMGPDARDATYADNGHTAYDQADLPLLPGAVYRDPHFSWVTPIGVTGVEFLSTRFPQDLWHDLLVGESNNGQLYRFELDATRSGLVLSGPLADGVADSAAERDLARFGSGFGVVTDLRNGPEGWLYAADHYGGRLLRVRPLADRFAPGSVTALAGAPTGDVAALAAADDVRYLLGPTGGPEVLARRSLEACFGLHDLSPARLDLVVEARASRGPAWMVAELWHVPSASWTQVASAPVATRDGELRVEDIPGAAQYVDGAGELRLRLTQIGPATGPALLFGLPGAPAGPFRAEFDLARLLVTWP